MPGRMKYAMGGQSEYWFVIPVGDARVKTTHDLELKDLASALH